MKVDIIFFRIFKELPVFFTGLCDVNVKLMNAIINISTVLYKSLCCASTKYEVQFCHARRSDGAGVSA